MQVFQPKYVKQDKELQNDYNKAEQLFESILGHLKEKKDIPEILKYL